MDITVVDRAAIVEAKTQVAIDAIGLTAVGRGSGETRADECGIRTDGVTFPKYRVSGTVEADAGPAIRAAPPPESQVATRTPGVEVITRIIITVTGRAGRPVDRAAIRELLMG